MRCEKEEIYYFIDINFCSTVNYGRFYSSHSKMHLFLGSVSYLNYVIILTAFCTCLTTHRITIWKWLFWFETQFSSMFYLYTTLKRQGIEKWNIELKCVKNIVFPYWCKSNVPEFYKLEKISFIINQSPEGVM